MVTHLNLHYYEFFIPLFESNVVDKTQANVAKSSFSAFKYSNWMFDSNIPVFSSWNVGRWGLH